jgi:C1A family cysteine protease
MAKKRVAKKRFNAKKYVLNCVPSTHTEGDWTFEDALISGVVSILSRVPSSKDLRASWWTINNQGSTGACVGFATAYGVLRWHYVKAGKIKKDELPSARFIWMANKETDEITSYPTTFIETAGTQTKLALRVAQRFGCVTEDVLPMDGELSTLSRAAFYSKATKLRISSYHNLGRDLDKWKKWLASQGPILTRLNVDKTWDRASLTEGYLEEYQPTTVRGGHAVCLVGYTKEYFIVRNSWGTNWGDGGVAYASNDYTSEAFTEAYGAVL